MVHCDYYRCFIYMYAAIVKPLYALLVVFEWNDDCDIALDKLKVALISYPILKVPDWNTPFHVHIDASNFMIGYILFQPGEHNMDFPISCASRQLNMVEKNYTKTEREGLTMIYAIKLFFHYLLANKFVFFVDHQALLYLVIKPCSTRQIVRWFVILLEFDFTVVVKKGLTHKRADHMSRIPNGEPPTGIDDDIPDATLFQIEYVSRWSKQIVKFLSTTHLDESLKNLKSQVNFLEACSHFQLISD